MKNKPNILSWVLQFIVAGVILSTVPAKFIGLEASKSLFESINLEPHGRYIIASVELLACVLLLYKNTIAYGAGLTAGVMTGATIGHLTGIGYEGDYAIMGGLAALALVLSIVILFLRRRELPVIGRMFGEDDQNG